MFLAMLSVEVTTTASLALALGLFAGIIGGGRKEGGRDSIQWRVHFIFLEFLKLK